MTDPKSSRQRLIMGGAPLVVLAAGVYLVIRGLIVVAVSPDAHIQWPVKEFAGAILLLAMAGGLSLAYDRRFPQSSKW